MARKGRPKKRWKEVIEKDMLTRGLKKSDAQIVLYRVLVAKTGPTPTRG